jgi:hypothetical protein
MGALLDNAFETPSVILTDGNQVTGGLVTSTTDDAWVAEPDAPIGSVHYKTDGTRQTRIAFTGSGIADDFASENPLATGGGASVSFSWRFSTSTAEADPGNARIRFDNAVPANVTALFVDDFDTAGIDVSGILNAIPVGTRIYLQEQAVSGAFLIGTITAITDNTGWFKIELTVTNSGTLPANNKIVGVLFFAGGGAGAAPVIQDEGTPLAGAPHSTIDYAGAGVTASNAGGGKALITIPGNPPSDQPAVQARRTTVLAFTPAWVDVTLDATDFENDAAVVEHNVATDRITLKGAGAYLISYRVDTDQPAPITQWQTLAQARVTVNDVAAALDGSDSDEQALEDGSLVGDAAVWPSLQASFIYDATANDFVTLQIQHTESDGGTNLQTAAGRVVFSAIRLTGKTGPAGAPGSGGSTIRVGKTYAIAGEIKVPVGQTDFLVPFFVSLAAGQTADLVKVRHQINAGTSVTCKLQKNAVDITGFTAISVTTTPADTDPTDVALADNDEIALVVTAVAGTPQNMTFTIFIEHTG